MIPDCSSRTAWRIDKHVFNVPLTLMMGRRFFWIARARSAKQSENPKKLVPVSKVIKMGKERILC